MCPILLPLALVLGRGQYDILSKKRVTDNAHCMKFSGQLGQECWQPSAEERSQLVSTCLIPLARQHCSLPLASSPAFGGSGGSSSSMHMQPAAGMQPLVRAFVATWRSEISKSGRRVKTHMHGSADCNALLSKARHCDFQT